MWSADGKTVKLDQDGHGAITLDFACLKCHQSKTVEWASNYAKKIHEGISTSVDLTGMPETFELSQNYPNPFNPSTMIEYRLPERCSVVLEVLDIYGRTVRTLVNDQMEPGTHRVTFDASGLESGLYLYRLTAGNVILTRKMLLVK
ncbi:MAG: T9SS type A sorting domain-containing protein [Chlorobi bacterium]|nr:T9SS type A sorting domain-containing protein [Chlorobiota bacterium]